MFDKMFKEFGNDPMFKKMIEEFVNDAIIDINNELKFGKIEVTDDIVGATLLMVISKKIGIEFLKTINLVINGKDETAYANVNQYLNQIELLYNNAETKRDEILEHKRSF